jgi:hypothetical protein
MVTINNSWVVNTEYSNSDTRALLLKEVTDMVAEYKDTQGYYYFVV